MKNFKDYRLTIILIIFLLLNSILLFLVVNDLYFSEKSSRLKEVRHEAGTIYGYYRELAGSYGLLEEEKIEGLLAEFIYEIEEAESEERLREAAEKYGSRLQEELGRIRSEDRLQDTEEELELSQKRNRELENKLSSLQQEFELVKSSSGFGELSGSGVIVRVFDHQDELAESSIVHDNDIRTIINELFIAGARGIEVGGERLIATSAIRCVGPTILVNNEPISVDPIVIKAVGEPEILKSSLEIVRERLQGFGIELEIIRHYQLKLDKV
ncbi:MAG: DUF881 domain-containing protein [Halanaerobiaceae bacterium]